MEPHDGFFLPRAHVCVRLSLLPFPGEFGRNLLRSNHVDRRVSRSSIAFLGFPSIHPHREDSPVFDPTFVPRRPNPGNRKKERKKKHKNGGVKSVPALFFSRFDFPGSSCLVSFEPFHARFLATSSHFRSLASLHRTSHSACRSTTYLPLACGHVGSSMLRKRNGCERRDGQVDRAGTLREMDKQPRCYSRNKEWKGTMDKVSEPERERPNVCDAVRET